MRNRKAEIPKEGGKVRVLGIPTIRDRVVQGALKLILEPIFESDFQDGSYGYRPKRTAHQAVARVSEAVLMGLTRVIDLDLKSYFDTVSHSIILRKVAGLGARSDQSVTWRGRVGGASDPMDSGRGQQSRLRRLPRISSSLGWV